MITTFNHIVFVRYPAVMNMVQGTIYICTPDHIATWLCPCGCGNHCKVKIAKCMALDPYNRFSFPDGVAGYEINDIGEISFAPVFTHPNCPNGLVYGIDHNKVLVHS